MKVVSVGAVSCDPLYGMRLIDQLTSKSRRWISVDLFVREVVSRDRDIRER
ncbi:hypothetical protein IQ287_23900 [Burkholderia sp. R-69927]|uniref:hypothetical protein n=1 Tax=Paraburkholderia domus TaxID=2793075 RepID=UPI001914CB90|nr:hypothetical protein [Paraburkholderia domus]MBK5089014.1 hypothetical protein [Burkholderia sp. R-69927]